MSGPSATRFDARWLSLRAAADTRAREPTLATLVPRLVRHLAAAGADRHGLEIIDLGAGTGANQRWLSPRLPFRQGWLLVDPDDSLLRRVPPPPGTRLRTGGVDLLPELVRRPTGVPA